VGQTVRKGEVWPSSSARCRRKRGSTIAERAGEIEQLIAVAEAKLKRVRQLAERGITPRASSSTPKRSWRAAPAPRDHPLDPRRAGGASSAGGRVISTARAAAGQVVQAQDILFQIVDPKGLWVEALAFGEVDPAKVTGAAAVSADGTPLTLAFQGFSKALQQQATVVQFAVENPPASLQVGQPVTVTARNGAMVTGIILPRDAVVRSGNGEALVWRHTDPERFEAKPVRTEPFDATRLLVRAGVAEGDGW
jgi:hypothetical protein